jgi:hypothetical protein
MAVIEGANFIFYHTYYYIVVCMFVCVCVCVCVYTYISQQMSMCYLPIYFNTTLNFWEINFHSIHHYLKNYSNSQKWTPYEVPHFQFREKNTLFTFYAQIHKTRFLPSSNHEFLKLKNLEVCHPSCAVSMVWNLGGYIFTVAYIYTDFLV